MMDIAVKSIAAAAVAVAAIAYGAYKLTTRSSKPQT